MKTRPRVHRKQIWKKENLLWHNILNTKTPLPIWMATLAHDPPISTNICKTSSCTSKWDALSMIWDPTVNPRPALTWWGFHCSQKLLSSSGLNIGAVEKSLMVIFVKYVITRQVSVILFGRRVSMWLSNCVKFQSKESAFHMLPNLTPHCSR